ncbi:BrnT family toxin [Patescibacteria group bacterium]|nr:BrnT family toxin [Patescibacteria group bacterium]
MIKILPKVIAFEWDKGNIDKNLKKHEVSSQETEEVFFNKPFIVVEDKKHSLREQRFQALGKTSKQRKVFLSFTIRENRIRIISIRDMNKNEEVKYEKA